MHFRFGAAADLYEKRRHPRIAFGPDDVARLRERVKTGDGEKVMAALRRKAAILAGEILAAPTAEALIVGDKSHHSVAARVGQGTDEVGIVALLDHDERAMAAMLRLFQTVIDAPPKSFRHARVSAASLSLAYDYLHDRLPEDMRRAFRQLAVEEIRLRIAETAETYLRSPASNLLMHATLGALETVLAIRGEPDTPALDKELQRLLLCLEASLQAAIGPDGYPEEDTGYGTLVTARLVQSLECVRRAGIVDLYERCPHVLRFGQAMLHIVEPWGEDLANTGDHGDDFGQREFVLARLAAETHDPTLLWLLGTLHYHHGKVHPENRMPDFWVEVELREGFRVPASWRSLLVLAQLAEARHPREAGVPTAFMDRRRGVVSFRDRWADDATFLFVDASQRSPAGQGHAHSNSGHFILSDVGEYFSIGPGRYQNDQDQQSVVLIDGESGYSNEGQWRHARQEGILTDYAPGEFVDAVSVDASHHYRARWARRHVGLVKGAGARAYVWTVEDINKADDWAEFWWQLQTSPENAIHLREQSATIEGWRCGNLLDVHFGLTQPCELTLAQDICTSSSWAYLTRDPSGSEDRRRIALEEFAARFPRPAAMVHGPALINPRLLAKVKAPCGRFMSLMLPRLASEAPPAVEQLDTLVGSIAMRITFADVEDTIVYAYEHRILEANGIAARGDWCVVRRDRASGKTLAACVHHGTLLSDRGA